MNPPSEKLNSVLVVPSEFPSKQAAAFSSSIGEQFAASPQMFSCNNEKFTFMHTFYYRQVNKYQSSFKNKFSKNIVNAKASTLEDVQTHTLVHVY